MAYGKVMAAGWAAALAAGWVFAQTAALPTEWTGPWKFGEPPDGWVFTGLGEDALPDYDGLNDGAARMDGTGDSIAIQFDASAAAVSYWVKGLTFSGGVFRVEQSTNGVDWTALRTDTELPTNAVFRTDVPTEDARHIRFFYELKGTGNVGLDGISIVAFVLPRIASIGVTGFVATVTVPDFVPGRTYQLEHASALTNVPVTWTPADVAMGGTNALVFYNLAPTNALKRYYRVRDVTPADKGRRGEVPDDDLPTFPARRPSAPPQKERPLWR